MEIRTEIRTVHDPFGTLGASRRNFNVDLFEEHNTMKRIFALGLLLTVSSILAACGGSSTNVNMNYNSYGANNANAAAAGNTAVGTTNMGGMSNGTSNMSNGYTYNSNMSNSNMGNTMTNRGNSMSTGNRMGNMNTTPPRGNTTRTP